MAFSLQSFVDLILFLTLYMAFSVLALVNLIFSNIIHGIPCAGIGRFVSHKYGYGVIDTGVLVHEAALWKNVGPHLNYTSPLKVRTETAHGLCGVRCASLFLCKNSYHF